MPKSVTSRSKYPAANLRWLTHLPYLVIALGVALAAVLSACSASHTLLIDSYHDDAYYYFEVARHMARGDGSTFDGLSPTNGYHPLWLWLLTPLFHLDKDLFKMLVWVKAFSALFWTASIALVWAIARQLDALAEISVVPGLLIFQRGLWLSGMESTVALTLVLGAMYCILKDGLFTEPTRARLLPSAMLLALALMARLDLVFFVGSTCGLYFLAATGLEPVERWRRTIFLGLPSLGALLGFMAWNLIAFGTAAPVSAQAKSLGGPFWNPQVFIAYFSFRPISAPGLREFPACGWWLLVILPALVLLRLRLGLREGDRPRVARGLEFLAWSLIAGNILQIGYYAVQSSWPLWRWYFYFIPLLFVVSVAVLAMAVVALVRVPRRLLPLLPVTVALVAGVKIGREYAFTSRFVPPLTHNYKTQAIAVAEFLDQSLPDDAVVAMGDRAGSLGYLLERPLVQTEGLVNSKAFLDALQAGRVHAFLQDKAVDVVVYSGGPASGGDPDPAPDAGPGCLSIREPKFGRGPKFDLVVCDSDLLYHQKLDHPGAMGGSTRAWRYRADLNPAEPSAP